MLVLSSYLEDFISRCHSICV